MASALVAIYSGKMRHTQASLAVTGPRRADKEECFYIMMSLIGLLLNCHI